MEEKVELLRLVQSETMKHVEGAKMFLKRDLQVDYTKYLELDNLSPSAKQAKLDSYSDKAKSVYARGYSK